MRALIVGIRGFLGRAIHKSLQLKGFEIYGIDAAASEPDHIYAFREGLYESLEPLLRETDLVVYAAGTLLPRMDTALNIAFDRDCKPFNELVHSTVKSKSRARLLLISSGGAVYGTESGRLTEESPTRPASVYGVTRLFMEQSLAFHTRDTAVEPLVFRLSNIYGPGQRMEGGSALILKTLRAAAGHGPLTLWGAGDQTKDFLYVEDLLDAIGCALPEAHPERFSESVFNIAVGESHSVLDVIAMVGKIAEREVPLVKVEGPKTDVPHVWLSPERAARVLGWRARTGLEAGVRTYWAAVQAELRG